MNQPITKEEEGEEKKEEAPPPPPILPSSKPESKLSEFVKAYQEIWGMMVDSPYTGSRIAEWEAKVTIEGWKYALKESSSNGSRVWKYLEKILMRIEREGYIEEASSSPSSPSVNKPSNVIDFNLKDIIR